VWHKHGLIFDPLVHAIWIHSHAQVPTVFCRSDCIRVFFSGRNSRGQSFITYVDLDKQNPKEILYIHDRPIIPMGKTGTFDDEGMMPSDLILHDGRLYMYYSGWNRRLTSPYHNATGVLVSDDNGDTFKRLFEGPILDRIATEPYLAVTPSILVENSGWKMWYISGLSWENIRGKIEPIYAIKYAYSSDGVHWIRPSPVCIPQNHELEAFSRPCVIKHSGIYKMWFCYRNSVDFRGGDGSYHIGYAESCDGINWERMDNRAEWMLQTDVWEKEMQCYPYVVDVNLGSQTKRYMFYNGNGFGKSGFGYAEWLGD